VTLAGSGEGISREELQLAARNHGLHLEALCYPITPVGLHYLLIHYDIPEVDPGEYRLELGGRVSRPLSLSLTEIQARPAVELAVTMECAGNGRALIEPHVVSQPWLQEAVGTARWRGTPLRPLFREAGLEDGAVEVAFAGLDQGVEGGEEQRFERSLPLTDAMRPDVLLAYEMNGLPLPPQHGFPLRLLVPGWYGMASVKWLSEITVLDRAFAPACPGSRPGGLNPAEVQAAARVCGAHPKVRAMDIVEVDPTKDVADVTVLGAASFLLSFAAGVASRRLRETRGPAP